MDDLFRQGLELHLSARGLSRCVTLEDLVTKTRRLYGAAGATCSAVTKLRKCWLRALRQDLRRLVSLWKLEGDRGFDDKKEFRDLFDCCSRPVKVSAQDKQWGVSRVALCSWAEEQLLGSRASVLSLRFSIKKD